MRFSSPSSTSRGVLPGAMPVRLPSRKICVSTAIVASPNATFSTTFAVLRPTPGNASSAARSRGTSPPCFSIRIAAQLDDVARLGLPQSDRPDMRGHAINPQFDHRLRSGRHREQRPGRLVDRHIRRLRRQHHGNQQCERTAYSSSVSGSGFCAARASRKPRTWARVIIGVLRAFWPWPRACSLPFQRRIGGRQQSSEAFRPGALSGGFGDQVLPDFDFDVRQPSFFAMGGDAVVTVLGDRIGRVSPTTRSPSRRSRSIRMPASLGSLL